MRAAAGNTLGDLGIARAVRGDGQAEPEQAFRIGQRAVDREHTVERAPVGRPQRDEARAAHACERQRILPRTRSDGRVADRDRARHASRGEGGVEVGHAFSLRSCALPARYHWSR